jgi:putative ubiquitin-RnfH superfamily antitoxin RatB of RatAB toxin-antitoxin module
MSSSEIVVDVVYALPGRQVMRRIALPEGSTLAEAIRASGLAEEFPEIDSTRAGIFGKRAAAGAILRDRDRVEIYRPLEADPKEVRRTRAAKKRAKK